jgi:predicted DCC family thiol-disulfide oxidoreductase YuxK
MSATADPRLPSHALVLFDGVCNLCQGTVGFLLPRDRKGTLRFASLQSETGHRESLAHGLDASALDSVVLIEGGRAYTKSSAALRIARHLRGAWPLFTVLRIVPRFLRDPVYDWIARHRYRWFGKTESCLLPRPEWRDRFLG